MPSAQQQLHLHLHPMMPHLRRDAASRQTRNHWLDCSHACKITVATASTGASLGLAGLCCQPSMQYNVIDRGEVPD